MRWVYTITLFALLRNNVAWQSNNVQGNRVGTALYGIPKMFRWLTDQYPSINKRLAEGLTPDRVVDNFYLDMNGIIHPCTHGNVQDLVVLDEKMMFQKIFSYVDRLYKLVRPRNVLYLAVDGVAPRAKMNQQRSRRFRSGKEAEALASELMKGGKEIPKGCEVFDSNCITPGTDFMMKLSLAMEKWIEYKIETDLFWKNGAEIHFSGPEVPGEGEHKVMDYIRQIQSEGQVGLRHVLYGLDADLIMLGLVTHEKNFSLLREKMSLVMAGRNGRRGKRKDMLEYDRNDYELLELKALRQMLSVQFRKLQNVIPDYDPERVIDDFVFICMLVGNDFLPHCPHLEIDNGALSLMMSTYIELVPQWKGYLTEKEKVNPERLEQFFHDLSLYEQEHFKYRAEDEKVKGFASPSYNIFYYDTKLQNSSKQFRRQHVRDYLEGLHWVLSYYHKGCQSWNWYFPHLYSPLSTDMTQLRDFYSSDDEFVSLPFEIGKPIPSLAQLLSVLPPSSAQLLPEPFAELMILPSSPIAQFYPRDFQTDPNGKRQPWEHVVKIPFVDEALLMEEVDRISQSPKDLLTPKEKRRNSIGQPKIFKPNGNTIRQKNQE